jgi:hypothetical protein
MRIFDGNYCISLVVAVVLNLQLRLINFKTKRGTQFTTTANMAKVIAFFDKYLK